METQKFVPALALNKIELIKNKMLEGLVVVYDGRSEKPAHIYDRGCIPHLSRSGNLGDKSLEPYLIEKISIPRKLLYKAMNELLEDYVVHSVSCSYSGRFEYATWARYIEDRFETN